MATQDELKQQVAKAAVEYVKGGIIGVGTGSTANFFIDELAKVKAKIDGAVASSEATAQRLRNHGIEVFDLNSVDGMEIYVDGADEIDPYLDLVKGRGGALLYEKIVALSCHEYLIVAASEKLVDDLGTRLPLPVEIIPYGWQSTTARVAGLGIEPTLRRDRDGTPYISDGGHYILDCRSGKIASPPALADALKEITGVVDHGLFIGIATEALVVEPDGTIRSIRND